MSKSVRQKRVQDRQRKRSLAKAAGTGVGMGAATVMSRKAKVGQAVKGLAMKGLGVVKKHPKVAIAAGIATAAVLGYKGFKAYKNRDQSGCERPRYRRINPLNPKAARRATNRIKGAMKMLKKIESGLPKVRVKAR